MEAVVSLLQLILFFSTNINPVSSYIAPNSDPDTFIFYGGLDLKKKFTKHALDTIISPSFSRILEEQHRTIESLNLFTNPKIKSAVKKTYDATKFLITEVTNFYQGGILLESKFTDVNLETFLIKLGDITGYCETYLKVYGSFLDDINKKEIENFLELSKKIFVAPERLWAHENVEKDERERRIVVINKVKESKKPGSPFMVTKNKERMLSCMVPDKKVGTIGEERKPCDKIVIKPKQVTENRKTSKVLFWVVSIFIISMFLIVPVVYRYKS